MYCKYGPILCKKIMLSRSRNLFIYYPYRGVDFDDPVIGLSEENKSENKVSK